MYRGVSLILIAMLLACTQEESRESTAATEFAAPDTLNIYTVNNPLAYFAERIAGDRAEVSFAAPPDIDPANWSPDAETIIEYQQADLIVLNGAGYAAWVTNAVLPRSRLVDTTSTLADRLIPIENAVTHSHGPAADHSHSGTAFTTWLDLDIAIEQARSILERLIRIRPDNESEFRQAFAELEADLRAADAQLQAAAENLGNQAILFSHPVYQYLERRYALNGYSVHWEPDVMPEEADWDQLQAVLQQHPAKIMIWEADPLPETTRRLADLGIECVVFQPGGNRPLAGDWLDLLRQGIAALEGVAAM